MTDKLIVTESDRKAAEKAVRRVIANITRLASVEGTENNLNEVAEIIASAHAGERAEYERRLKVARKVLKAVSKYVEEAWSFAPEYKERMKEALSELRATK